MSMTKRFIEEFEMLILPDDADVLDMEYEQWLQQREAEKSAYEEMLHINPNFASN